MLSEQLKDYIEGHYAVAPVAGLSPDEQRLLALLAQTLPASDRDFEGLLPFVQHGLFLREYSLYCRQVPEDIFLHYVLYPRVNSEQLVEHRRFFFQKLSPLVAGKTGVEAALAVNRWCAAQMTYESTDGRTIDPLTAYYCGLGRCGEESVFAVSALRSVGIPARQVYTPWWSHCDDNHAWVEVYVDGDWHFLGACEPEPILDRGWFTSAATRAMVVVSRSFFDYGLAGEAVIHHEGRCRHHNQIARYADTSPVTVTVLAAGKPAAGAEVRFGVLNMGTFALIASLVADAQGRVTLEAGRGSLLVEARLGDAYGFAHYPAETTVILHPGAPRVQAWDVDFLAPTAGTKNRTTLTKLQQVEKEGVLAKARQQRLQRMGSYFLPKYQGALAPVLQAAGANAATLWRFYEETGEKALALLGTLAPKDYRDVTLEALQDHLKTLQGPRIGLEALRPWRKPILEAMGEKAEAFQKAPRALWAWIQECFREDGQFFYEPVWLDPLTALHLGAADERGRRVLFVAACRSLGLMARLDPVDGSAQVLLDGSYTTVEDQPPLVKLEIIGGLPYYQNWTLARWDHGWQTLELSQAGPVHSLPQGKYRLITTNRLPNGNQLAHFAVFDLKEDARITLQLRQGSPQQMLAAYPVPLTLCELELRLYLEVGAEPTEHALNELLEAGAPDIPVRLLIRDPAEEKDPTLQKVLAAVPGVRLEVADFSEIGLEALARALYLEPGVWPLLTLTNGEISYYAHCGYGVNTVPLALKLARSI